MRQQTENPSSLEIKKFFAELRQALHVSFRLRGFAERSKLREGAL